MYRKILTRGKKKVATCYLTEKKKREKKRHNQQLRVGKRKKEKSYTQFVGAFRYPCKWDGKEWGDKVYLTEGKGDNCAELGKKKRGGGSEPT